MGILSHSSLVQDLRERERESEEGREGERVGGKWGGRGREWEGGNKKETEDNKHIKTKNRERE